MNEIEFDNIDEFDNDYNCGFIKMKDINVGDYVLSCYLKIGRFVELFYGVITKIEKSHDNILEIKVIFEYEIPNGSITKDDGTYIVKENDTLNDECVIKEYDNEILYYIGSNLDENKLAVLVENAYKFVDKNLKNYKPEFLTNFKL
jgi:hypothetical protein